MDPKPKINDQFWFDYSESVVKDSILRLDNSLQKNALYMKTLLGIYTVSSIFSIDINNIDNIYIYILFFLPFVIYLIGNWHAASSAMPTTLEFDPRSPDDIQNEYSRVHKQKEKSLEYSLKTSLVLTMLVATILLFSFMFINRANNISLENIPQNRTINLDTLPDDSIKRETLEKIQITLLNCDEDTIQLNYNKYFILISSDSLWTVIK